MKTSTRILRYIAIQLWRWKYYQPATELTKWMGCRAAKQHMHAESNPFSARTMRGINHITKGVNQETIFEPDCYWRFERYGIHEYLASSWFYGFGLGIWAQMQRPPNERQLRWYS